MHIFYKNGTPMQDQKCVRRRGEKVGAHAHAGGGGGYTPPIDFEAVYSGCMYMHTLRY